MQNQVKKINELYRLRKEKNYNYEISVDGGIDNKTARYVLIVVLMY